MRQRDVRATIETIKETGEEVKTSATVGARGGELAGSQVSKAPGWSTKSKHTRKRKE